MKRHVLIVAILLGFLYSYNNNRFMLEEMLKPQGWIQVEKSSDSLIVSKKQIFDLAIPAYKATMLTSVPLEYVMSAVLDADGQQEFLSSSHVVESTLLDKSIRDTTFLYQMLDLPVISDRHYITKNYTDTLSSDHYQLNWEINILQNKELFKDLIAEKREQYSAPLFVEDGVGSWEIKRAENNKIFVTYYILINPGGWIPSFLVSYANKELVPGTVEAMVKEGRRRAPAVDHSCFALFCVRKDYPLLEILDAGSSITIENNLEIDIFLNREEVRFIERWSPSASENDCEGDVCLNRIYRIELPFKGRKRLESILGTLSGLSSVVYAEEDAARNILIKRRSN